MAVAEQVAISADATAEALEHMAQLEADGVPRAEAARATALWCQEQRYLADIVESVVVAGLISLAGVRDRNARKGWLRRAQRDGAAGIVSMDSLEPLEVVSSSDILAQEPARVEWLEIPYTSNGVQVAVGDLTGLQLEEVLATYAGQAAGKLKHMAYLRLLRRRTPNDARVREAVGADEARQLGRQAFSTDTLAQIWQQLSAHECAAR